MMSARPTRSERQRWHLPEDLTQEPPHEPWPVLELALVVAGDGVHSEYDHLRTLALRPYYYHYIAVSERGRVQ